MFDKWNPLGTVSDVGFVDVEWRNTSHSKPNDTLRPVNYLHGRIYYPTPKRRRLFSRSGVCWLPGFWYAYGLGKFLFFRRAKSILNFLLQHTLILLIYALGSLQKIRMYHGAEILKPKDTKLPLVVFSHGLAGHRSMYAIICAELASHGYLVFAIEHTDGTASAAKLPGSNKFLFYTGLGGQEGQENKTMYRMSEMKMARLVLKNLNSFDGLSGISLSKKRDPREFFRHTMDTRCLAAVGHSYGGATVAGLCSSDPSYRCAVSLDPWWPALASSSPALNSWETKSPLLVLGSHDWNVPNETGQLPCDGYRQKSVLDACRIRKEGKDQMGAGALFLAISGSSHNTFADPLPLFSENFDCIFRLLGLTARLDAMVGIHLVNLAILNFLSTHLPLNCNQRQLQSWSPSSSHKALSFIWRRHHDNTSESPRGLFWFMHKGKGILNAWSDKLLDQIIRSEPQPAMNDAVTKNELLETMLPSSTDHQAPSSPTWIRSQVAHDILEDPGKRLVARNNVGRVYSDEVQSCHVHQMISLLGEENVFSCQAYI
ncbi:hypothetical protein M9434_002383 [Picochlorum sp. BPE23]|nr:hypothetical protein M9434_002383 [Picochlorum sp. BPE23]